MCILYIHNKKKKFNFTQIVKDILIKRFNRDETYEVDQTFLLSSKSGFNVIHFTNINIRINNNFIGISLIEHCSWIYLSFFLTYYLQSTIMKGNLYSPMWSFMNYRTIFHLSLAVHVYHIFWYSSIYTLQKFYSETIEYFHSLRIMPCLFNVRRFSIFLTKYSKSDTVFMNEDESKRNSHFIKYIFHVLIKSVNGHGQNVCSR